MKALVINLTRFGDLLQTQPVISALAQQSYETAMMCLENFAGTTRLMRDVAATFPLPGAPFLASLDRDWRESVNAFESYCTEIEDKFDPDLIINLTPSVPARLIALRLAEGREVRGFAMDEFGFNADTSPWAGFLQVASSNRGSSPFNVVDLFSKVAGFDRPAPFHLAEAPPERTVAALELFENFPPETKGFVGFQPGASEERRRWPVAHFRELGMMLWNKLRRVPVLLGTEGEQELGQRILDGAGFPYINLMGKTSLPELMAVLHRLDLLITNDTGTMHLAAGAGTPVAAVFLATAQPWDTGPAAENSLCLEPDVDCHPCPFGAECPSENMCRHQVGAAAVFEAVSSYINEGRWPRLEKRGVRSYLTVRDGQGFMTLTSLSGHEHTDRYKWIMLQRDFYRRFLDGEEFSGLLAGKILFSDDFRARLVKSLSESRDVLFLLSKQAVILQADPIEAMKVKFLANFQKIQDILSSCPELSVLSSLWDFEARSHDSMQGLVSQLNRYMGLISAILESVE
ncbi:glycosyltransferase family 9 protein [Maridesulfovibrio hydrothermalis]|uniref:Glycosyl transferase family 9 n=1 Tax=Maridesulfovibrio hydrothermalis AM13 = DSM 14728 TaxID=1121451 RepID=L0RCF4_9BACT|nr:glycosyltransferase family 9 protein [Maridesulfovibrio hydrothermalis]CCO23890.1 Glycosyl transferase family 9 [Maridesulfovibrio hydrothermalis AM13 = DSM 14728]